MGATEDTFSISMAALMRRNPIFLTNRGVFLAHSVARTVSVCLRYPLLLTLNITYNIVQRSSQESTHSLSV